jgi:hypothetical protein
MEQLQTIKGRSVTIPKLVNRYLILAYNIHIGWSAYGNIHATPEGALQAFLENQNKYRDENIKYYKLIEVELEIPFVPCED